jgi:hypothetical protein
MLRFSHYLDRRMQTVRRLLAKTLDLADQMRCAYHATYQTAYTCAHVSIRPSRSDLSHISLVHWSLKITTSLLLCYPDMYVLTQAKLRLGEQRGGLLPPCKSTLQASPRSRKIPPFLLHFRRAGNPCYSCMALSAHRLAALGTASDLHRHTAFANRKL